MHDDDQLKSQYEEIKTQYEEIKRDFAHYKEGHLPKHIEGLYDYTIPCQSER